MVSRLKKVIFSNVQTDIPNTALQTVLDELQVKRGSIITTLKATIHNEGYNHVASFRRQTFVNPEDINKIPDLFILKYNGLDHFIFTSSDVLKCFLCNTEGHLAKNCTFSSPKVNTNRYNTQITEDTSHINTDRNMENSETITDSTKENDNKYLQIPDSNTSKELNYKQNNSLEQISGTIPATNNNSKRALS